jgi:hypothetical protein
MKTLLIITLTCLLSYSFIKQGLEDEEEITEAEHPPTDINDYQLSSKLKEISCQTCRKLKKHREVTLNVWECTKCKRRINLN